MDSKKLEREVDQIRQWQESVLDYEEPPCPKEVNVRLAGSLSTTASSLWLFILEHGPDQLPGLMHRRIQREYGYFQLWCDGYGVATGNLDDTLAQSRRLRLLTYRRLADVSQVLTSIADTVAFSGPESPTPAEIPSLLRQARGLSAMAQYAVEQGDDSNSDSDSDTDSNIDPLEKSNSTLESLVEDLASGIQCLVDLGPSFDEPVLDKTPEETAVLAVGAAWNPVHHLTARILHRYPDADSDLARVLGQANWKRLGRLLQTRETNMQKLEQTSLKRREPGSGTVVAPDCHDSGIGTSISAPASRYADTVLSYHGSRGSSVCIPPVSPEGLQGQPFTCEICAVKLQILPRRARSLWKKHVISDLQPYTCIVPACSLDSVQFPALQSWTDHIATEHDIGTSSGVMECPICRDEVDRNKISHLARHLEEISLTILPASVREDNEADKDKEDTPE